MDGVHFGEHTRILLSVYCGCASLVELQSYEVHALWLLHPSTPGLMQPLCPL